MTTEKTAESCYGVRWTEDDMVLCALTNKIEVCQGIDLQLDRTIRVPGPNSAALVDNKLFTSSTSSKEKKYMTYCGSLDEPTQTVLHREEADNPTKITHISANKEYVASLDYVNKTLKVFSSIDNEHLFDIPLTGIEFISPLMVCWFQTSEEES